MVSILKHFITFNVNGIYHYLVKLNNNGTFVYGIVKSKELVDKDDLIEKHMDQIVVHDNLSILLNTFVDLTKANRITCSTTDLDINHSETFISFQHGLRPDPNGYKINLGDRMCPDWDVIETPKEYLGKLTTKNSIVYILKTKDNVTVVS